MDEAPRRPWTQLALFAVTVASVFRAGAEQVPEGGPLRGWIFAVPLLAILVTHELGHYLVARRHRVEASLPYFLPFPFGPIGTLGAVISMRGRIKSRDALLDVGASGPIAGLIVAIPVLVVGLRLSTIEPIPLHGSDEGQSLLYLLIKRLVLGPIPSTHDVFLHPTAFAGWVGLFLTMFNLLPMGQLDGGHVAYALFGSKQDRFSRLVHRGMLVVGLAVSAYLAYRGLRAQMQGLTLIAASVNNWLVWWVVLGLLMRFTGGTDHPPTEDDRLSPRRRLLGWATLALFVLLFMPIPFSVH